MVHAIYFYVCLFAFSQTYDFSAEESIHYASNFFSVVFIILCVGYVVFVFFLLRSYAENVEREVAEEKAGKERCGEIQNEN